MGSDDDHVIANRDEPIPVIHIPLHDNSQVASQASTPQTNTTRSRLRSLGSQATNKIRDRLEPGDASKQRAESSRGVQDRLMNLYALHVV